MNAAIILLALAQAAPAAPKPPAPKVEISADQLEAFGKDHMAFMSGHVTARRAAVGTAPASVVTCDKLTAIYEPKGGTVKRIVCQGNVRIVSGLKTAEGQEAELNNETGEVRLTGDPVVHEGEREARGKVIVYNLDQERVTIVEPILTFPSEETKKLIDEQKKAP